MAAGRQVASLRSRERAWWRSWAAHCTAARACYPSMADGRRPDPLLPHARPRAGGRARRAARRRDRVLLQRCGTPAPGRHAASAPPRGGRHRSRACRIRRRRPWPRLRLPAQRRPGRAPLRATDGGRRATSSLPRRAPASSCFRPSWPGASTPWRPPAHRDDHWRAPRGACRGLGLPPADDGTLFGPAADDRDLVRDRWRADLSARRWTRPCALGPEPAGRPACPCPDRRTDARSDGRR